MKFTNKTGIQSQALIDALCDDDYDLTKKPDNVWSCTEIIGSAKIAVLKRRHWDDMVVDASDRLWVMLGSAMHMVVEHKIATKTRERLSEERWVLRVPCVDGDWKCWFLNKGEKIENQSWYKKEDYYVSGRMDTYDASEKVLEDYKFTSAWTFVFNSREDEWTAQLNMNRFAVELAGFPVEKLRIGGLLRDWDKKKVSDDSNYPKGSIVEKDIKILSDDEVKEYIIKRVTIHAAAMDFEDDDIPECTQEERWYRGGKYALMKMGRKRAEKLFEETPDGKKEAEWMCKQMNEADKGNPFYIEPRPGEDKRCHEYCDCNDFCHYFQELYGQKAMTADQAW